MILVDELAHSNVEGSRHAKRWQDIEELRAAGIEVWTALNVQHLESLNGTVGAITGVRVHETVPDAVLDEADEVVLVDATPDELAARLAAGKVYLPQQAERAAQNFFRKGNLIALREIALRRTAEHVEDDVRGWRVEQSSSNAGGLLAEQLQAWNTSGAILACVGPSEDAAQTVRTAARLAGQLNVRWHAVYVETPPLQRLPAARRDRVLAVLALAEELGAATAVLTGNDVAQALASEAQRLNCATVVIGRPAQGIGWRRWWPFAPRIARDLPRLAPSLDIVTAGSAGSSRRLPRAPLGARAHRRSRRRGGRRPAARTLARLRSGGCGQRAHHAAGDAADACAGGRQHRHAVPAGRGGRGAALRARAGRLCRHAQRGGLRLLLRRSAPVLRRERLAVPGDLRGDVWRSAC